MPTIGYTLFVDDVVADDSLVAGIQSIESESHVGMADILRLRLRLSLSDDGSRWGFLDDGTFARLTPVRLLVTIGTGLPDVVFDGFVTETEATVVDPESGSSTLEVIAMDHTAVMNLEERSRAWPNMTDSLIAMQIFADYGLVPVADASQPPRLETETTVLQRDTDIRFLRHLAQRNGFDVFVRPSAVPGVVEGHFHAPRVDLPPQGVLTVGITGATNVGRITVKNEMLRPTTTVARGVDASRVTSQEYEARDTSVSEMGGRSLAASDRPRVTMLRPGGLSGTGELQTAAQASVDRSTWAVTVACTVDSHTYGDVARAGSTILLRGAGQTLNGEYYVERVLHTFEGEDHSFYRQQLTLRRNALEPTGTEVYLADTGLPV
jgi:phage protein D